MKKTLFILIAIFVLGVSTQAQNIFQKCASTIVENQHEGLKEAAHATFHDAQHHAEINKDQKTAGQVYRVPIVFHVVYNTEAENVSDELIQSQLDVLNEDFRRLNANASETRDIFLDRAGDAEIEFYLAETDPNGEPTTGITRTQTDVESFLGGDGFDIAGTIAELESECGVSLFDLIGGAPLTPEQEECVNNLLAGLGGGGGGGDDQAGLLDGVKFSAQGGVDAWDTKKYLNIWVCDLSISLFGGDPIPSVLGFAYPPTTAPNWPDGTVPDNVEQTDGVVIHYQAFGKNNPNAGPLAGLTDQGRTTVHEVGHYLGLRHIWGDGDCTEDDGISDTPAAADQSQQDCNLNKDTCTDDDEPDMVENYMDYSSDVCMNMFTVEQIALMRSMLETARVELLDEAPSVPLSVSFEADVTEVFVGETVTFTSTVSGGEGDYSYTWIMGDGTTLTDANPTHTYEEEGLYTVILVVNDGINEFTIQEVDLITVNAEVSGISSVKSEAVNIYPNPTQNKVFIDIKDKNVGTWTLNVLTINGKSLNIIPQESDNGFIIDLQDNPEGLYIIHLNDGKSEVWQKILLEK